MRVMLDPARAPTTAERSSSRRRRRRLAAVVVVVAVLVWVPRVPGHHQASVLGDLAASDLVAAVTRAIPVVRDRPAQPCARLESEFETNTNLLRNYEIGWYASIWSDYHALNAVYFTSLRSGDQACRTDFEDNVAAIDASYWDTSYGRAPAAFDQGPAAIHFHPDPPRVDDSLWMALAVDQDYLMTGNRADLARAAAVFRMAIANWDPRHGGIYWKSHTDGGTDYEKAVVSNAPAVVLGSALYAETGQSSYLTWSARILDWVEDNLRDPGTGLYDDHVGDDTGPTTIDADKLTYNQGIVVGAMAALATVDPAEHPLVDAVDLARRSMAYFRVHHTYGIPPYDAIWAQNLLWTAGLYGNATFAGEARSSLELARGADPIRSADLLDLGAEMALEALGRLPATGYPELCPVRRPGPAVRGSTEPSAPGSP
jgi:hypothetical protein